jgi:(heptosyl)LPS beta-1,4-glucosyltransferase
MAKINSDKISIIILAGNEEKIISDCLKSCLWADQIVLVAANSTDKTISIAKKLASKKLVVKTVFDEYNKNFSRWRNLGFKSAKFDWIFYVDSDERVTNDLKKEIQSIISQPPKSLTYYAIPRQNYYLGHRVKYGGSYPDYVKRLFHRLNFKGYSGDLHEEPLVSGSPTHLAGHLLHYTHRDLSSMLQKTIAWTDLEAQNLYRHHHPPVVWWRFPRMMFTKFFERLILQQMWRDGVVGWISVIFETFDTFIIYARLWEIQQQNNKINP